MGCLKCLLWKSLGLFHSSVIIIRFPLLPGNCRDSPKDVNPESVRKQNKQTSEIYNRKL